MPASSRRRPSRPNGPVNQTFGKAKTVIGSQHVDRVVNVIADPELVIRLFGRRKPPAARRQALDAYLRFLHDRHRFVDFRGMGMNHKVALRLELADLYVPLKARMELPEGETVTRDLLCAGRPLPDDDQAVLAQRLSRIGPVNTLLERHAGVVIVGDPGSGKTTFLKHLAVQVATGRHPEKRFPILASISAYANAIAEVDRPLQTFLPDHLRGECGVDIADAFESALAQGVALILLDGLDEVRDAKLRRTVVRRVEDFFNLHRRNGNKFVLTSRIVGYREVRPVADDLAECTLEDFQEAEIELFTQHWTRAMEKAAHDATPIAVRDAEREQTELMAAVHRSPGVRRLASNPLLLTILALMKREGVSLPERRAELYQKCVETLVANWNLARGLGRAPSSDLDPVQTLKILAPLALWMHEVSPGIGLVAHQELLDHLTLLHLLPQIHPRPAKQATPLERHEAETAARRFLADVHDQTSVLLERAIGRYGFLHLTFEEYLAAVELALRGQDGPGAILDALRPRLHDPAWREVILLTVGHVALVQRFERTANTLVEALLTDTTEPRGAAIVLAGEALLDVSPRGVSEACRRKTVAALRETLRDVTNVSPPVRARAGAALGRLGDDRPGVAPASLTELAQLEVCYVPGGPFCRSGAKPSQKTVVPLPEGYWIGRFPVTVAQFALFVADDGYANPEWWTEAREAGAWSEGQILSQRWSSEKNAFVEESRRGPGDSGHRFTVPNHPRVDVNWYEASAYCCWLNARLPQPRGWHAALPSADQCQKAARGGIMIPTSPWIRPLADGLQMPVGGVEQTNPKPDRKYPWGSVLGPEWANYEPTGIEGTSAVGCFTGGISPYAVEDLSGNAWEWCVDRFAANHEARVLRGGSWAGGTPEFLSCGSRNCGLPLLRNGNFGFRCVWVGESAR